MKLTSIQVHNFLGARAVNVKLTKPVALFTGKNFSGKSSLQEAVRMALTGESVRVALKKDYAALVSEGQESGFAEVEVDGMRLAEYSVILPSGKGNHSDDPAIPYALDAQRFARLNVNDRRAFLFGLMNLKTDGAAIKDRLTARGCDPAKIEATMPLLRAGFAAACDEAKGKARDAKSSWRTITGETYGDKKAASFKVEKPEVDAAALHDARIALEVIEREIETETTRLGDLQGRAKQAAERESKLGGLKEQAGRFARIREKLSKDESELQAWRQKVAILRDSVKSQDAVSCPDCGVMLVMMDGELVHASPMAKGTEDDLAKLPEYEKAMKLMENCVANGKRDLAAADAAANALREMDAVEDESPSESEITALKTRIDALKLDRTNQQAVIRIIEEVERIAATADEKTNRAAAAHADVEAWGKIADALAPDGIPGDMLAEALGPINARLEQSAADAEWPRMMIDTDMSILNLHKDRAPRDYALLSESEKWRADAMIAEAIAHLSGVRLLVLDRFDVLDIKGREDLLYWLDGISTNGDIDTALIFGTLKRLPAQLPESAEAFWIENGVAGKMEAAA